MDHIDRARPEIKSAKKLGRVRYEPMKITITRI
jgi:hypothetical protein